MNNLHNIFIFLLGFTVLLASKCDPEPPKDLCSNRIKDAGELGVDCGGICPECHEVNPDKEVFIHDLSIINSVEATNGALSFGQLISNMTTNSVSAKSLVLSLMTEWENEQVINGFSSIPRNRIRSSVIDNWKAKDGQSGVNDEDWLINLNNAPFKLLGITNRLDLGNPNNAESAGEGRLTYCLVVNDRPQQFTWIFEYHLPTSDEYNSMDWAIDWHMLSDMDMDSTAYMSQLLKVLDRFTSKNAMPDKPNGSAISQIRTNEISLSSPWELREFRISETSGLFRQVSVKMTPDLSLANNDLLLNFITQNADEINEGTVKMPDSLNGVGFLAASTPVPTSGFKWNVTGLEDEELRSSFSKLTCNGCHGGEFGNTGFTHIKPPSTLLGETGTSTFMDLDVEDRAKKLRIQLGIDSIFPEPAFAQMQLLEMDSLKMNEIREIRKFLASPANMNREH